MVDEASTPDRQRPSEPGGCTLDTNWIGRTVVVAAVGTVDVLTAPQLTEAVEAVLTESPSAVIIDLTEVDFLASHGMRVLIQAHNSMAPEMAFLVVADGPITARPMKLIGLTEIITVYPTLGEALLGLAA